MFKWFSRKNSDGFDVFPILGTEKAVNLLNAMMDEYDKRQEKKNRLKRKVKK